MSAPASRDRQRISPETRAAIEQLLRDGLPDRAAARRLGVHHATVAKVRAALGLAPHPSGRKSYPTVEDAWRAHVEPVDGGHLRWTGGFGSFGNPQVMHHGRTYSAYRIAFRLRTGRDPVGAARPACGYPRCVEPSHIDDQAARDRDRRTYTAIFGGGAP